MPLRITYKCPSCFTELTWIYQIDDENPRNNELTPDPLTGCPGNNCTQIHELDISPISEDDATTHLKDTNH